MMYQFLDTKLCSFGNTEVPEKPVQADTQDLVDDSQIDSEEKHSDDDDDRCPEDFLAIRPGHLLHFTSNVGIELLRVLCPVFN